jgi:hypothetical protein
MQIYTVPEPFKINGKFTVFLGGSIENGAAEEWQQEVIKELKWHDVNVLNPRRENWDPTWEQSKDNAQFRQQVEWELNGLGLADMIIMYLSPGTISPVSLLELGLYAKSGKLLVFCPNDFTRAGNVHIVCEQNHVKYTTSRSDFFYLLNEFLKRSVYIHQCLQFNKNSL